LKTYLRALGSNPDLQAVREVMPCFDAVMVGQGGFRRLSIVDPDLVDPNKPGPEIMVWTDPFTHPTYRGADYDLYPSPEDLGHDAMPLIWGYEETAHAYDWFRGDWPRKYFESVKDFVRERRTRILADCWTRTHGWWNMMLLEHYERTKPSIALMLDLELRLRDVHLDAKIGLPIFNGAPLRADHGHRFWELYGRDAWHTAEIHAKAVAGDWIYCSTGRRSDWEDAVQLAGDRGCHVGCGHPDNEPMVDPTGNFRGWIPGMAA